MTGSVHVISHPLVQHKLTLMRRRETAPPEFRVLMRDMGTLLLYEATRDLPLHDVQIETPLVRAPAPALSSVRRPSWLQGTATLPTRRSAPGRMRAVLTRWPSTNVPFAEERSSTRSAPPDHESRA